VGTALCFICVLATVEFSLPVSIDGDAIANADRPSPWNHVRKYPIDGTFVQGVPRNEVYVFASGSPQYVSFTYWQSLAVKPALHPVDIGAIDNSGEAFPWIMCESIPPMEQSFVQELRPRTMR
jgi:hypothetical protein